jgi:endonuclease III
MGQTRQYRLRQNAAVITRLLENKYRTPHLGNFRDPIKELVYISLTRQTHGPNARASWARVFEAGGPPVLLHMSVRRIAAMIKVGGFSRQKAAWISESLKQIQSQMGTLSLAELNEWGDERVESFLRSLPGVGIKTARCIMMYSMMREVLPVDVHVRRLATRIGLVRDGLSEKAIHAELDELVAPKHRFSFHVNSICHGRQICRAMRPKCHECIILEICKFGRATVRSGSLAPSVGSAL